MITDLGEIATLVIVDELPVSGNRKWRHKQSPNDDYYVANVPPMLGAEQAFLLKIPPGGKIHRHTDETGKRTIHIPIQTNPKAVIEIDGERVHMAVGRYYEIDRSIPHESRNDGDTDRIHLMLEYG